MIDTKLKENGLANSGTGGPPSCDKKQLLLGKKAALKDVQNKDRNIVHEPLENIGLTVDAVKLCGYKRPKLDCPRSPTCSHSPRDKINGANGHLMHSYKKAKLEQGKFNACDIGNTDSAQSRQPNNDIQGPHVLRNQMLEPKFSCFPAFAPMSVASQTTSSGGPSVPYSLGRPSNGLPISQPDHLIAASTTGTPSSVKAHNASSPNSKERFLRLQIFLQHCNESSQEEYIKSKSYFEF